MSAWLIFMLLAAVGVLLLWQYGQRPRRYRNVQVGELARFIQTLLKRGYQGGLLILETKTSRSDRRFLQFSKYIREDGRAGLEFGFPNAPWSRAYYDALRRELDAKGVAFTLQDTGRHDTTQFLVVDLERDVTKAQRVAELAVPIVFGGASTGFQAHYENVSAMDVKVGR